MKLSNLGFDQWFESHTGQLLPAEGEIARVTAVDRGSYLIRNESAEVPAELTGKLSYQIQCPADLPCVGDWVKAQYYDNGTAAVIHGVFPRKTFLRRRTAGANVDYQMIASNVDAAIIVQSCHFDFNPNRLDRYLVAAKDGGVEPVIVLTKTDLISAEELDRKRSIVGTATKATVLALSSVTGCGFDEFRQILSPRKTYCLLGSSGVGKTTILNRLMGREAFDTRPVSGSGEGIHTTSRRQLIVLDHGAMLIDTPGMREFGLLNADDGVAAGFEEMSGLSAGCRYADCSHRHEPGCAVLAAVANGNVSKERYASYVKLRKESEYYGMTYHEKRKKDKDFGRFIKQYKNQKKG